MREYLFFRIDSDKGITPTKWGNSGYKEGVFVAPSAEEAFIWALLLQNFEGWEEGHTSLYEIRTKSYFALDEEKNLIKEGEILPFIGYRGIPVAEAYVELGDIIDVRKVKKIIPTD